MLSTIISLLLAGTARADIYGVDISKYQGTIDWDTLRNQTSFVMIKAGGSDDGMYTDPQFASNQAQARRLDMVRGYYYYTGGTDPVKEAEHFVSIVGPLQPGEVLALDLEIDLPDPVAFARAFMVRTEQLTGVKPLLYSNMNRIWQHDWTPLVVNGNKLWGAYYDSDAYNMPSPGSFPGVTIKQYSSSASVPGISGPVDVNVFKSNSYDFPAMGKPAPPPAPPAPKPTPPQAPAVNRSQPDSAGGAPAAQPASPARAGQAADGGSPALPKQAEQPPAKPAASTAAGATVTERAFDWLVSPLVGSRNDPTTSIRHGQDSQSPVNAVEHAFYSLLR
ncbi:MAG: glycoside hydrolase family 25 protein [Thermoleophilia bacterium]